MTERNDRDDSNTTEDSVEIPVTVEGDEESDAAERTVDSEEGGAEQEAFDEDRERLEDEQVDPEQLDDLYLDPEESDVEVVEEKGDIDETELVDAGIVEDEADEAENVDVELAEDFEETTASSEGRDEPEGPSREELADRVEELESEVEQLEEERDNFEERMLRAAADLENFRKRSEREKDEIRKYGSKDLVEDLLETIDNLERALEHSGSGGENENIIEGVEMVLRQIHNALGTHGIKAFEAEGKNFDPEYHEAIQQVETSEHESGTILEQHQKGYMIHDRLLRPAVVSVAKNVSPDGESDDELDGGEDDASDDADAASAESEGGSAESEIDSGASGRGAEEQ